MLIICDTREQTNQHILKSFEKKGIRFEKRCIHTGDYMNEDNPSVRVERKKNLDELCRNLFDKNDKSRFWRELKRSKEEGLKFYVVCEHGGTIRSVSDVVGWKSKYSRIRGYELAQKIYDVSVAYNIEFIFCCKNQTANKIIELLKEPDHDSR